MVVLWQVDRKRDCSNTVFNLTKIEAYNHRTRGWPQLQAPPNWAVIIIVGDQREGPRGPNRPWTGHLSVIRTCLKTTLTLLCKWRFIDLLLSFCWVKNDFILYPLYLIYSHAWGTLSCQAIVFISHFKWIYRTRTWKKHFVEILFWKFRKGQRMFQKWFLKSFRWGKRDRNGNAKFARCP